MPRCTLPVVVLPVVALPVVALLAAVPTGARAQPAGATPTAVAPAPAATRAAAVGVGLTTGIVGAEYVVRSVPGVPRLGAAATAGFFGPGGRVSVALLPPGGRVVPYLGAGVFTDLWGLRVGDKTGSLEDTSVIPAFEGGVQLWPAGRRGLYADLGAGVTARRGGWDERRAWLPRVLVGGAF